MPSVCPWLPARAYGDASVMRGFAVECHRERNEVRRESTSTGTGADRERAGYPHRLARGE